MELVGADQPCPVDPAFLSNEHVYRLQVLLQGVVSRAEPPHLHARGRAAQSERRLAARDARAPLRDCDGIAAAVAAAGVAADEDGFVPLQGEFVAFVPDGAEGGAAADDPGRPLPDFGEERGSHIAPGHDELVPGRQQVAMVPEAGTERGVPAFVPDHELARGVKDGTPVNDAHRGIPEEDIGDPERAVAEEQPRLPAACIVTGEVEPGPVAVRWPEAEGVRHAHVAAGGVAAGLPYRRRRRRREQLRRS